VHAPGPAAFPDPADLLGLAVRVVRQAAELVREGRTRALVDVTSKSTPTDVVSALDHASERLVVHGLLSARPEDGVLGEEGGERTGSSGVRWLLDPVDGTVNYLYGLPQYAVSLAAEVAGTTVAGVVHAPATGEEWTAVRGRGAYKSGRRLRGSTVTTLAGALVGTGFGYAAARRAHQASVLVGVLPEVRDVRRIGAASIDLCYVAEGSLDAYFEKGLHPWDHAAGGLVAEEAGLRVGGLGGRPAGADFLLAAPPGLYEELDVLLTGLDAAGGP